MPSFTAATLAATAFAALGAAAPTARTPSPTFTLEVTSIYSDGTHQYSNTALNSCHTAAGQESLCVYDSSNPAKFTFDENTKNIIFPLEVNGGSSTVDQPLTFQQDPNVSTLSYGFFGTDGATHQFAFDANNQASLVSSDPGNATFYICPEYLDYNHEGYETLSLVGDYSQLPAGKGCDAVTLRRTFTS